MGLVGYFCGAEAGLGAYAGAGCGVSIGVACQVSALNPHKWGDLHLRAQAVRFYCLS
jgi:hypothetical protein